MMTMFRNLTTFLMGSPSEPELPPPNFDQIEDVEEDWIFVQNREDGPKKEQEVEEKENKVDDWENTLIEHPSMSVYKSITWMEEEEEASPPQPNLPPAPLTTNNKQKRPKNNNNQLVEFFATQSNNFNQQRKEKFRGKHQEAQAQPTSRKQKYKNAKGRMNNDRKCGCRNFI